MTYSHPPPDMRLDSRTMSESLAAAAAAGAALAAEQEAASALHWETSEGGVMAEASAGAESSGHVSLAAVGTAGPQQLGLGYDDDEDATSSVGVEVDSMVMGPEEYYYRERSMGGGEGVEGMGYGYGYEGEHAASGGGRESRPVRSSSSSGSKLIGKSKGKLLRLFKGK